MKDDIIRDMKKAVIQWQTSEKLKSELIIASRLVWRIEELKDVELVGAKKLMTTFMDSLSSEISMAYNFFQLQEIKAIALKVREIGERIGSGQYQAAIKQISESISLITTCGQRAAEKLQKERLF